MRKTFIACFLAILTLPLTAFAEDPVGKVARLEGDATAARDGLIRSLDPGSEIYLSEIISTGSETRLEIMLLDETSIILSDRTIASVSDFAYLPEENKGNAAIRLLTGAFRAVTGKIASLEDREVVFQTPVATIGIRGTDFFGGLEGRKLGVALLDDSALNVENDAGGVDLAGQFQGTDVEPGMPPSEPHQWPEWRIQQSIDKVTFFDRSMMDFDPFQNRTRRPD
jgi:hypothetical protein